MSFLRHRELVWLAEILRKELVGARVQKVRRRDMFCTVLQCYRSPHAFDLLLSVQPAVARISLSFEKAPSLPAHDTFATWIKSNLQGHRITAINCDSEQRVVTVQSGHGSLVAELFGKQPRMIGVDSDGIVRCCTPPKLRTGLRMGEVYQKPTFVGALSQDDAVRYESCDDMERHARQLEVSLQTAQVAQRRDALVKRARKQFKRLHDKLLSDRKSLGDGERWKRYGELLKGEVWRLERGMDRVEVTDYFDTELARIEIPLDPKLNGAENVERYFKRYRRGISGHDKIAARLEQVEQKQAELESLIEADFDATQFENALRKLGVRLPQARTVGRSSATEDRKPYHEFISIRSERILVGRGGTDNHQTTFRVGKGNDHWLHVKDAPGAHVLVPVTKGQTPHPETILDALALAVHYSKLRGEPDAWVTHTQRKYVRPIPGGPAGRVIVQSEKVKQVSQLPQRISRLFNDRTSAN